MQNLKANLWYNFDILISENYAQWIFTVRNVVAARKCFYPCHSVHRVGGGGVCPVNAGIHIPCPVHAGIDMVTAADRMHPSGMHSCYYIFSVFGILDVLIYKYNRMRCTMILLLF